MNGFDYGNARLRARGARLLGRRDYAELLASRDLDDVLGKLAADSYGADVEAALPRFTGIRRVDEAVRSRIARELAEVRSFYSEPVADRLAVVHRRWEVAAAVALLRAQARRGRVAAVVPMLVPAGRMSGPVLDELAAQPGLRPMVDLMIAWRVPTPELAAALRRAVVEYETSGEPAVLEAALQRGFAEALETVFTDEHDDCLSRQLLAEKDQQDLLMAVRLRAARHLRDIGPEIDSVWNPGGRIPPEVGKAIVFAPDRSEVVDLLSGRSLPPGFLPAVQEWARHGDAAVLAGHLDAALFRLSVRHSAEDPLGMGVPVGYLWALENEARNLRLVARVIGHGLDREEGEMGLVVA